MKKCALNTPWVFCLQKSSGTYPATAGSFQVDESLPKDNYYCALKDVLLPLTWFIPDSTANVQSPVDERQLMGGKTR